MLWFLQHIGHYLFLWIIPSTCTYVYHKNVIFNQWVINKFPILITYIQVHIKSVYFSHTQDFLFISNFNKLWIWTWLWLQKSSLEMLRWDLMASLLVLFFFFPLICKNKDILFKKCMQGLALHMLVNKQNDLPWDLLWDCCETNNSVYSFFNFFFVGT